MWVVKLGGSLLTSPTLPDWLAVLSALGKEQIIIVPGGGVFADQVRIAQQRLGFDDMTAHQMAILAMDQYGLLLAGLQPGIRLARTEMELHACLKHNQTVVWLPSLMLFDETGIDASWDMTSDSISLWLAQWFDAEHLLLVKSISVLGESDDESIVDPCFSGLSQGFKGKLHVLCADQASTFHKLVGQLKQ